MTEQPPDTPELKHRERKRFGPGCIVGAFGILVVLYLLSPPFVLYWMSLAGGVNEALVEIVYAPILFAMANFPAVQDAYSWYFSLFPATWPR